MMAATPLGTLGVLPPEIRHMIYGHLLGGSYMIAWTVPHRRAWQKANPAILRTSKQINAEAMRTFYIASQLVYEFVYEHLFEHLYLNDFRSSHPKIDKVFENSLNITLTVDMRQRHAFYSPTAEVRAWKEDFFGVLGETSLMRLYRNNVVRKRIKLKYFGLDLDICRNNTLPLPLLQNTKYLTCFKLVQLEFVSIEKPNEIGYTIGWFYKQQNEQSRQYIDAIKADFETTLGPAITIDGLAATQAIPAQASDTHSLDKSAKTVDFNRSSHYFDWRLEFHPFDHMTRASSLMLEEH